MVNYFLFGTNNILCEGKKDYNDIYRYSGIAISIDIMIFIDIVVFIDTASSIDKHNV